VGLRKVIHGRWSCLPLAFACYLRRQTWRASGIWVQGEAVAWIYGAHLHQAPPQRYATAKRTEYAFADLRRALAKDLDGGGFSIDCRMPGNATRNPLIAKVMDTSWRSSKGETSGSKNIWLTNTMSICDQGRRGYYIAASKFNVR
jgi:hypothetical protein